MKCTTKLTDYQPLEVQELMKKAEDFKEIFENADKVLRQYKDFFEGKGKKPQVTVVEGEAAENCVWIDPSIAVKFQKMKDHKLPFHKCVEVYDEWFDQLFKLVLVNEHALRRKTVYAHVVGVLIVCSTFGDIIAYAIAPEATTKG